MNYYVYDVPRDKLVAYVKKNRIDCFIIIRSGADGFVLCEGKSQEQDGNRGDGISVDISKSLNRKVIYNLIHDSDMHIMKYYNAGKLLLDYDSDPRCSDDTVTRSNCVKLDAFRRDNKLDAAEVRRLLDDPDDEMSAEDILSSIGKTQRAPDPMCHAI